MSEVYLYYLFPVNEHLELPIENILNHGQKLKDEALKHHGKKSKRVLFSSFREITDL